MKDIYISFFYLSLGFFINRSDLELLLNSKAKGYFSSIIFLLVVFFISNYYLKSFGNFYPLVTIISSSAIFLFLNKNSIQKGVKFTTIFTYLLFAIGLSYLFIFAIEEQPSLTYLILFPLGYSISFFSTWFINNNFNKLWYIFLGLLVIFTYLFIGLFFEHSLLPYAIIFGLLGYYIRNNEFGFPFRKLLFPILYICLGIISIVFTLRHTQNDELFIYILVIPIFLVLLFKIKITKNLFIFNILSLVTIGQLVLFHELDLINNLAVIFLSLNLIHNRNIFQKYSDVVLSAYFEIQNKLYEKSESVIENTILDSLPDFSDLGQESINSSQLKKYSCLEFGINPRNRESNFDLLQTAIDQIGISGGGILEFTSGEFIFNNKGKKNYLTIDYSNIILRGSAEGGTIFRVVNPTLKSERNPWISPFFIQTGHNLQKPNLFFGVESLSASRSTKIGYSLTDPGSDGTIQEPKLLGELEKFAIKGSKEIIFNNAQELESAKFVMVVMFNNDHGDLLRNILNRTEYRNEWSSAINSGKEHAGSYQEILEISSIEGNIIKLKKPLKRDLELQFTPKLYAVDLLENIGIESITFTSNWSGVFRHHGAPFYYSTNKAMLMDYGWNAINLCRVYNSHLNNLIFKNFTNPLYIQDSLYSTVSDCVFDGHDGHQGIKLYGHTSHNLLKNLFFKNHYSDMIGGEGNCYNNAFSGIHYINFENKPVEFDFHGFTDRHFSPPAFNLFENCTGFRGIKGSGTLFNQPPCATGNIWWNILSTDRDNNNQIFKHDQYKLKQGLRLYMRTLYKFSVVLLRSKRILKLNKLETFIAIKKDLKKNMLPDALHFQLFRGSTLCGFNSLHKLQIGENYSGDFQNIDIHCIKLNQGFIKPFSIIKYSKKQNIE